MIGKACNKWFFKHIWPGLLAFVWL